MAAVRGERAAGLLHSVRSAAEIPSKLEQLQRLRGILLHRDPTLLPEFVPRLAELQADRASPVRKLVAEMIGDIALKHMEFLPEMVPILISFLEDETPAVARQAISTGTLLFLSVLEKVVIQGLHSSEVDDSLKSSWQWMLRFKGAVFPKAVQPGSDGVRLLAVKFIEAMVLLYTPDPNVSSDPPHEAGDGLDFNISWLRGGHPLLNVGDLAMEASQSLGLLLEQLRLPQINSLSTSIIIVLINSLSAIAQKRPSFYGRILPVLLCLDPASSVIKGGQIPGAHHALKNAFVACLKCTHSSAEPWRARLVEALKVINAGELTGVKVNQFSEGVSVSTEESLCTKDNKFSLQACDEANGNLGHKRHMVEESSNNSQGDAAFSKRARHLVEETSNEPLQTSPNTVQNNLPLNSSVPSKEGKSGPVQQLVGMFGALVAQGDKAAGSLEILISSISSDLLAEVVMTNMQHLPPTCPQTDGEEELVPGVGNASGVNGNDNNPLAVQLPALVSDILSLSSSLPLLASLLNIRPSVSHDIAEIQQRDEVKIMTTEETSLISSTVADGAATISSNLPASVAPSLPLAENGSSLYVNMEAVEGGIPGLDSTSSFDEIQESVDASHSSLAQLQDTAQENTISSGSTLPLDVNASSYTATYSEVHSPSVAGTDTSQATSVTSGVTAPRYILPKMTFPNVNLTDEDKDCLQKVAFVRIVEAYKQVAISGGSHIHFSLLAHLGVEFPLELDSWGFLQKHVLADYLNHEGHELTLRVLYRLYRETEQDQDFLTSRTATSIYETFLVNVVETVRDTFPASDKSLSRLLNEVPYLPECVLKLLECLCSPESKEKYDRDIQSGDRVTQGLSAVWSLILLRPSNRDRCLEIALQSAVHHVEEVRMKAIRLVANKLFPITSISQKIEDFANEKLHSVIDDVRFAEPVNAERSISGSQKDGDLEVPSSGGQLPASLANDELTSDSQSAPNSGSSSISEAQQCMSLYFALCTKKHSLLRQIFDIYKSIPKSAKQAVHGHIPILIRTIGSSPELLSIISDPPTGSESLLLQVVQTLTDGPIPSQDLISSVKKLYHSKLKDTEIVIPILSFLSKDEILPIFPRLVNLPVDKFQTALTSILQGSPQTGPSLSPAEILIAIHGIDPEKDGTPLKKVMDACSACFEQRKWFTQQVLAKVLNQLVEQIPLPLLFMRTVIQAIGIFPALVDFVMEILSRLVSKQIWRYPKLWVGFVKCAIQTKPQSFKVLLQLPAAQLENALNKNPVLKAPLVEHANQPNIRSTLPRSTLLVLGLAQDSQPSGQTQTSQSQAADTTTSSAADAATEVTQASSAVS